MNKGAIVTTGKLHFQYLMSSFDGGGGGRGRELKTIYPSLVCKLGIC